MLIFYVDYAAVTDKVQQKFDNEDMDTILQK